MALLVIGLLLPVMQAYAVDVYYARAIGQEYVPDPPPAAPAPRGDPPASAPAELPDLGARGQEQTTREGLGVWSKLLIGVVLVAAVAALGDGDGGSAQVNVAPSAAPDPAPPAAPSPGNGAGPTNGGGSDGGDIGASGGGGAPAIEQDSAAVEPSLPAEAPESPANEPPDSGAGGGPAAGDIPGADGRGGFDIDVAEDRIRVDIGDERFEFERGNGRGDDRGRGRGRGGDRD